MGDMTTRLQDATATLKELEALLREEENLDQILNRLVDTAVRTVPGAAAVTVTVLTDDAGRNARTAAATDEVVVGIDTDQYASGEGPCLKAARERHPVRVSVEDIRDQWPEFAESATRAGMRSYLSSPLLLDDEEPELGALNVYGRDADAFDSLDEALVSLYTTAASSAIVNSRRYRRARELAENMRVALSTRAEIDQAKGVLMARHGVPAEHAFEMLVQQSQHTNTKVRDVARALLESVAGSLPGHG